MMTITMNSSLDFGTAVRIQSVPGSSARCNQNSLWVKRPNWKVNFVEIPLRLWLGPKRYKKDVRWSKIPSATDSNKAAAEPSITDSTNTETTVTNDQLSSSNVQIDVNGSGQTSPIVQEPAPKRSPLTAREKLRAARVLSKYAESQPSKPKPGSRVLDALRESDKGKKRSGLPEAPTDLLDDSKRGLPKQGLTFDLPGGTDLFIIVFSFIFISTVMFATTYIVWKSGAIHFNEY
ncbi:hypothetical protein COCNU_16G006430 [Cocos nucifera]|uniref:Uncharacterized protein n=1 Tax=Cocos nucifera TaxID=13894 RepID=A0A8K0IZA0_COCNU|nr:hypothetical protein COCNU_16G006430 [Cocos nucifera]